MARIPELIPNEGLISLRNTFGIDPRYLLADYNQYYTNMNYSQKASLLLTIFINLLKNL